MRSAFNRLLRKALPARLRCAAKKRIYRRSRMPHIDPIKRMRTLGISFLLLIITHIICIREFEAYNLYESVWLSLTTATTVGYGDYAPVTLEGRIATVLLIYFGGGLLLTQAAVAFFEHRQHVRNRILSGQWKWNMQDHIVFFNAPENRPYEFFYQAVKELRQSALTFNDSPVVIVTNRMKDEFPQKLKELDIVHVTGLPTDAFAIDSASASKAHTIVVLAHDTRDPLSDSLNFDIVSRLKERGFRARIICEVLLEENRERMLKAGAHHVIRPIRAYPEMAIRTILAPGIECVMEDLFSSRGDECARYEISYKGPWKKAVARGLEKDIGIICAYVDRETHKVITNPPAHTEIDARAFFMIVREGNIQPFEKVAAAFALAKV